MIELWNRIRINNRSLPCSIRRSNLHNLRNLHNPQDRSFSRGYRSNR